MSDTINATADQKSLLAGLKYVSQVLPSKPSVQVLLGVKIDAAKGHVLLSAFDFDESASQRIDGTGTGTVLVGGKLFLAAIKTLDSGQVSLVTDGDFLVVSQGDLNFGFPLLKLKDYPPLPAHIGDEVTTLKPEDVAALARVTSAVSDDKILPVLTCVELSAEPGSPLTAAATDRYRLAVSTCTATVTHGIRALISGPALTFLQKNVAGPVDVRIAASTGTVSFISDGGDRSFTTRLQEGTFPKWQRLVPTEFNTDLTVDSAHLTKAIKQVTSPVGAKTPVRLECSATLLRVGLGGGINDEVKASKSIAVSNDSVGDEVIIAFRPALLLDGICAVGTSAVRLRIVGASKPALVVDPDDASFLYLLMPYRPS